MTPLTELREKCRAAIKNGTMEQCFDFLEDGLTKAKEADSIRSDLILLQGRLNFARREEYAGRDDSYKIAYQQISSEILTLLSKLQDEHINFLNRINRQILIFCPQEPDTKKAEWENLFNKDKFSHSLVLCYDKTIPSQFLAPDVVIFDDSGPNARPYMVQCAETMPQAHFLYYGELNPFTESRKREKKDAAIYERCANANSKFTVHARLRELLEFRKIYGVPASTNS